MTELIGADVRDVKCQSRSSIHRIIPTRSTSSTGPVMVVSDTYIPVRTLQRLAPVPVVRLRPKWGRIAIFVVFCLGNPALVLFPHQRAWVGLLLIVDVIAFVLSDDRKHLPRFKGSGMASARAQWVSERSGCAR